MIRAESAEAPSCKEHNLTVLFIHIFKILVSQKGFLPVCGLEKILSLANPTFESQPVRQSVADGPCPWYFMAYICQFTLRKPTAVAVTPKKLINASKWKTFSAASIR